MLFRVCYASSLLTLCGQLFSGFWDLVFSGLWEEMNCFTAGASPQYPSVGTFLSQEQDINMPLVLKLLTQRMTVLFYSVLKWGRLEKMRCWNSILFHFTLSCKVEIRKDSLLGTVITDALLVLKYIKNNSVFIMFCLIWLQRASPEFKKLQWFDLLTFSIRDKYNSRKKKCTSFFLCTHRKKLLKLGDYLANEMQILLYLVINH